MASYQLTGTRQPMFLILGIRLHIFDRLNEWFAAGVMLGDALMLSCPGLVTGTFSLMRPLGISDTAFAMVFTLFGSIRVFALIANGNIPTFGPRARSICAFVAGPVWALLALQQVIQLAHTGHGSLALPVYSFLALAEMATAIRATYDVGRV